MNKIYEVVISQSYFVQAKDIVQAKAKGCACGIGQTRDCEYGGMRVTAMLSDKKKISMLGPVEGEIKRRQIAGIKEKETFCHPDSEYVHYLKTRDTKESKHVRTTGRNNRNTGKECNYINFSSSDGI